MKFSKFVLCSFFLSIVLAGCVQKKSVDRTNLDHFAQGQLTVWNKKLSDVIIRDIFSPPTSSRIYAYCNIAAYEALVPGNSNYISLSGQLNGLKDLPKPEANKSYYYPVSSVIAFSTVSQKMILSYSEMEKYEQQYLGQIRQMGIPEDELENSIQYGRAVGKHILQWMKQDRYAQVKDMPRYSITKRRCDWEPTPPDYAPGAEPHWGKMRTFALDSAGQLPITAPTAFDSVSSSRFYKEAYEVYDVCKSGKQDLREIALYWDDNPNTPYIVGHVTTYRQKLSPGGHWLAIASNAITSRKLNMIQSAEVFALVSISLADGFINCWHQKYILKTIRPETYIRRYIDQEWVPVIQTPPFPEYPSGHSVISGSASAMLTSLLGDSFAFTDSSETPFELPVRKFESFYAAAQEASYSRMYGGIHFRPALENGVEHGKALGLYIFKTIHTRKSPEGEGYAGEQVSYDQKQ